MATFDINAIRVAIAGRYSGISGINGASTTEFDAMPGPTPWVAIGMPTWTVSAGTFEELIADIPAYVYFERVGSDPDVVAKLDPFPIAIVAAFRQVSLGGAVTQTLITTLATDRFAEIGTSSYRVIEVHHTLLVLGAAAYTV